MSIKFYIDAEKDENGFVFTEESLPVIDDPKHLGDSEGASVEVIALWQGDYVCAYYDLDIVRKENYFYIYSEEEKVKPESVTKWKYVDPTSLHSI